MGVAATQMERRGIPTDKGEVNRQIAADNKLLKEINAHITRLYNWSKEQAAQPQGKESMMAQLWKAQQDTSRYGKVKALQESTALFDFLQSNCVTSICQLHEKDSAMNSAYYDLRGQIIGTERRIATLTERLEMWEQYNRHKSVRQKLSQQKPKARADFEQRHSADLALFDAATRDQEGLKDSDEVITPKQWKAEFFRLSVQKDLQYIQMRDIREEIKRIMMGIGNKTPR